MKLSSRQKAIIHGLVLGDAYLQKTGKSNARLRIEHSIKQRDYVNWKYRQLENLFKSKPKKIERIHPESKQKYHYLRLQSHSSPFFGQLREKLYNSQGKRQIPKTISKLLTSSMTLAVWYMDDGYYYKRDKSAHIYLSKLKSNQLDYLVEVLGRNYALKPKWYCRPDKKGCQLNFTGQEKNKLFQLIKAYVIPSLKYKISLTP